MNWKIRLFRNGNLYREWYIQNVNEKMAKSIAETEIQKIIANRKGTWSWSIFPVP